MKPKKQVFLDKHCTGHLCSAPQLSQQGGGFWAFAGGMIFDYTGGFRSIFVLSVGTSALAVLCMALIREKRHSAE